MFNISCYNWIDNDFNISQLGVIMQKPIVVVLFLFLLFVTQNHKFVSEQPKVSEISTFEQQFGSKLIPQSSGISYSVSPDLCPAAKKYELAQPKRFARPGKDLPPFVVEYYYSKSDSMVRCIVHTVVTPQDGSFDKFGISFYESVFSDMISTLEEELGKPDQWDKDFKREKKKSYGKKVT